MEETLQNYYTNFKSDEDGKINLNTFLLFIKNKPDNEQNDTNTEKKVLISQEEIHIKDEEDGSDSR